MRRHIETRNTEARLTETRETGAPDTRESDTRTPDACTEVKHMKSCIRAKTVYTGKKVVENAFVVFDGTKVDGVSKTKKGKLVGEFPVVTPAFIDPHSHIGMHRAGEGGGESNDHGDAIMPLVDALDSVLSSGGHRAALVELAERLAGRGGERVGHPLSDLQRQVVRRDDHLAGHELLLTRCHHVVQAAGRHVASWDGRDATGVLLRSGVYFGRLEFGGEVQTTKLILTR